MSDSPSRLPSRPSLEQLRKQAKDLLRQYRAGDTSAVSRFRNISPRLGDSSQPKDLALADAQERLPRLKHLTHLNLGGSTQLTGEGLKHLAGMPQLQELDLSGSK